jgi:two-component system, chemotaxis family, chemotaxis protein CheY
MSQILIVDDSKTIRASVRFMLPAETYELHEAGDGEEALKILKELHEKGVSIDMIVSDYNMPNMGGIDFLKAVKADDTFSSIPFLMATTESEAEKRMEGKKAGAVGWLVKPYNQEQFLAVVKRFTGNE